MEMDVCGMEVTGLVISLGTAILQIYSKVEDLLEARGELRNLRPEFEKRVQHIRASVYIFFHDKPIEGIPGYVLGRTLVGFQNIDKELNSLLEKHGSKNILRRTMRLPQLVEKVSKCNDNLKVMESEINLIGLLLDGRRVNLAGHELVLKKSEEILQAVKTGASRNGSENNAVFHTTYPALRGPGENVGYGDAVPVEAKQVLDALSKSGIPNRTKLELSSMARKVWEDWKVNPLDLEYVRKRNSDRLRIGKGTADVYLANMKLHDRNEPIEVAVKQFVVRYAEASNYFPLFIREVYIQKQAHHDCIVHTFGGYWPDPEELEGADDIEPIIVMERMTHNLLQAQEQQLMNSMDSKRRILRDVAEGISHLHSLRIVHRDIKRKNVLVRVVDGGIYGRAKLCNFGFSRKAHMTGGGVDNIYANTGPFGTSPHRAPEADAISAPKSSKTAQDIWSFGVLVCEVLAPDFIHKIDQDFPGIMDAATTVGQNKEKVNIHDKIIERANGISSDDVLRDVAIKCLSLNPKSRPRIEEVLKLIGKTEPTYKFHFMNYMSLESRKKEVIRYVQNSYDADAVFIGETLRGYM